MPTHTPTPTHKWSCRWDGAMTEVSSEISAVCVVLQRAADLAFNPSGIKASFIHVPSRTPLPVFDGYVSSYFRTHFNDRNRRYPWWSSTLYNGPLWNGGQSHLAQRCHGSAGTTSLIMIILAGPSNLDPATSCIWPGSR